MQSGKKKYEAYFSSSSDILPRKMLSRRAPMCDIRQSSGRQEICDIPCRSRFLQGWATLYLYLSIVYLHLCLIVGNLLADRIFAIYHASHDSHKKRGGFSSYRSCSAINNPTLSKFDRNSCREMCIVRFERGKISISIPLFKKYKMNSQKKFHFFSNVERKKKNV